MLSNATVLAATGAWLGRLPAPARAAAQAATDVRLCAWFATLLIVACVCALATRVLSSARVTAGLGNRGPFVADALAAGALALAVGLANAVCGALAIWRAAALLAKGGLEAAPGLVFELRDGLAAVPTLVAGAIVVGPPLLWLMRRRPRSWPLAVAPIIALMVVASFWLPYALSAAPVAAPVPPGPARAGVERLVAAANLPVERIEVDPALGGDADVTGGLGPTRVLLGPRLLAAPPAQSRALVGHLMGHYAHADILITSLVVATALGAGLWMIRAGAPALARAFGAGGARLASDLPSLPAAAFLLVLTLDGAGLAAGAYLRWANVRADAYSLDHAGEPDGLAAVIERNWDHEAVDPSPIEEAIFYTHPPLRERIRQAMAWKAWAMGARCSGFLDQSKGGSGPCARSPSPSS